MHLSHFFFFQREREVMETSDKNMEDEVSSEKPGLVAYNSDVDDDSDHESDHGDHNNDQANDHNNDQAKNESSSQQQQQTAASRKRNSMSDSGSGSDDDQEESNISDNEDDNEQVAKKPKLENDHSDQSQSPTQKRPRHSSDSEESGGSEWKGSDKSDDDDDDDHVAKKPKIDKAIEGSKNFKDFLAQREKSRKDDSDSDVPEEKYHENKYIDPDQLAMNLLQKEIEKYKASGEMPPTNIFWNEIEEDCAKCNNVESSACKFCGCSVCAGKNDPELMLCCDSCLYFFHLKCLDPPLDEIPGGEDDDWFCSKCIGKCASKM